MKKIVLVGLLIVASSFAVTAQTIDEIVSKHAEAIGGKANWDKVKSLKMEGVLKAQGAEVHITSFQVDKKAMRQNISVMGMNGYSIVTTTEGWQFMPFQGQTKPEPMTADDIKNSQDQLSLQDEFLTYKELGKKIELIGKDDVDGTECFKIKMTDKNAKETTYFIDPSNYYLIKQTNKVKADGKEMESSTSFSDYKKLDSGIVYAMNITSDWGQMQVVKVDVNPTIEDSTFKLPN
jgi:hypothetical protein